MKASFAVWPWLIIYDFLFTEWRGIYRSLKIVSVTFGGTMRTLASFSIKGFLPKLAAAFFVVWFAFVVQHLWLYIDDYIGKGLEPWVIFKSLGLQSLTIVPAALPAGILFSSIIYFGELGENSELTALKSSGISVVRFLRPMLIFITLLAIGSYFFNDKVIPRANIKAIKIYYEVSNKKPALNIKAGEFYTEIPNQVIYVRNKDADNSTIHGVKIFDNTDGPALQKVIIADKGKMFTTADNSALIFELFNGWRYEEIYKPMTESNEQIRLGFKYYKKVFDIKDFDIQKTSEDYFKNMRKAMTVDRISKEIDSAQYRLGQSNNYVGQILSNYLTGLDSAIGKNAITARPMRKIIDNDSILRRSATNAEVNARSIKNAIEINIQNKKLHIRNLAEHKIELHRRFTIPFACLLLFVIGAALGAIIRKGGLGMPFIIAVIFFAILHIMNTMGEKYAQNLVVEPWVGMWTPTFILSIVAIFLLIKANNDAPLLNKEWYFRTWTKIKPLFVKNKTKEIEYKRK